MAKRIISLEVFLAHAYQFERNRLAEHYSVPGDQYTLSTVWAPDRLVWKKLRSSTKAQDIDPVRYIRWSFEIPQTGYPPNMPEPNSLLERQRMVLFKNELPSIQGKIAFQFSLELRNATTELVVGHSLGSQSPEAVEIGMLAGGTRLGLSPLFCYMLARHKKTKRFRRLGRAFRA